MIDQMNEHIKAAMKKKETSRLTALRYLKSLLMENQTSTKPIPEIDVLSSYRKKLNDSLEHYKESKEQQEKIYFEIKVVEEFLPAQLSESEVQKMIQDILQDEGISQMGQVMKNLSPQIKGRFDGKKASQMVNQALSSR